MSSESNPVESRPFHEFKDENVVDHGVVYSDQEDEYDPVDDAEDLPDLYRYLEALNSVETDLDGPHAPPQLFSQPEHKHNINNIQLLTYEADEEKVHEYVEQFETAAVDEILTVGKISLEEIQEEEKRLRDEHIAFQQQELNREKELEQDLLSVEEDAKKRVALELKAIKCYSCISLTDDKCGERSAVEFFFSPPDTVECSGSCAKAVAFDNDVKVITRSCTPICVEAGLSLFGTGVGTSCCKENKCNTAAMTHPTLAVMLLPACLLLSKAFF